MIASYEYMIKHLNLNPSSRPPASYTSVPHITPCQPSLHNGFLVEGFGRTESRKNIPTCLNLNSTFETHPYAHGTDRTEYILDWMVGYTTPHTSAPAHDLPASTRIDVIDLAGLLALDLSI